jgi:hypothetical protein
VKTKSLRLLLLAGALALLAGCQSSMDSDAFIGYRESQPYSGPTAGFYDPWYGGSGAYYGGGYGASVGVGISVPVIR